MNVPNKGSVSLTETRVVTETHSIDLSAEHWWKVSTEGDVEGRTTKNLGTHHGTLYEVARKLSGSASWKLSFEWLSPETRRENLPKERNEVSISVDHINNDALASALRNIGIHAFPGGGACGVTLTFKK